VADGKQNVQTAWMWPTERGGVNGAKIDVERGLIQWYDEIGCACDDSDALQSYAHFIQHGPAFEDAPLDVVAELTAAVEQLQRT
jgi:hypothetical protein